MNNRAKALEALNRFNNADFSDAETRRILANEIELHFETIREALSEPKWKSMDSAPRDGNEYLGWFPDLNERRVIWWCSAANFSAPLKGNADGFWNSSHHSVNQPTHWMHLPDAPTGEKS